MKGFLTILFIGCFQALVTGRHHHPKHHALQKRSVLRELKTPVMTLVDDVAKESIPGDHDKKLRILSQSGEMYPEHRDAVSKRKTIPNLTISKNKRPMDVTDDKKFKISGKDESDDTSEADDDKNTDSDDQGDDDSGSGADDNNDDQSDDDNQSEDDDSASDNETDKKTANKRQCRKRCQMPLTFHQCAFPRCTQKLGTIKDLCFFLCKHQKEKCERVCD